MFRGYALMAICWAILLYCSENSHRSVYAESQKKWWNWQTIMKSKQHVAIASSFHPDLAYSGRCHIEFQEQYSMWPLVCTNALETQSHENLHSVLKSQQRDRRSRRSNRIPEELSAQSPAQTIHHQTNHSHKGSSINRRVPGISHFIHLTTYLI